MMTYEQELENAVIGMCETRPSFNLVFATFSNEINIDYGSGKIIAPITEKQPLLEYFKRNGFSIKQIVRGFYSVSSVC